MKGGRFDESKTRKQMVFKYMVYCYSMRMLVSYTSSNRRHSIDDNEDLGRKETKRNQSTNYSTECPTCGSECSDESSNARHE